MDEVRSVACLLSCNRRTYLLRINWLGPRV
jgi:hypothetical protein